MTRKWVPSDYVDEITPPPRETPSDWVVDGNALAGMNETDSPRPLADGEIVWFSWMETLGDVTITINADGSWSSTPALPNTPAGAAFHIWIPGDVDTMSFDADSFAACMFEVDGPGECDASTYAWSIRSTPYCFHAGHFAPVNEAAAREG